MKKNIFSALLCALAIVGLAACNKPDEKFEQQDKIHSVTFKAQLPSASDTKTALILKVVPDWRNTDVNDVHIFETEISSSGTAYMMEASKVEMTTPVDGSWERAYFYAEFDNATVIVNPPTALTKAGSTFDYTAIMATRDNDKYLVPSVQNPHVESLIDPKADFLIGKCPTTYSSSRHEQRVNLNFLRPVALSRLAITNLEGDHIESVRINCVENSSEYNGIITGEVGYEGVDFETSTADFQANANSYELTMNYPDGLKRSGTTYAYMVTIPGKKSIKSIEVVTDQYIYTKSYANPASLTFYASEFVNIAMDMTVKEGGNVTRVKRDALEMEFVDAQGQSVSEFVYDLYESPASEFGAVAPTLNITEVASAGEVTYTSSNKEVATVDEEGNVTLTGVTGEATITANATGDSQFMANSASYKLVVVNNAPKVTYYKAKTVDAGYEYLIVSADNAALLSGESINAVAVEVDEEAGTVSVSPVEGILWQAGDVTGDLASYGPYSFSQGTSKLTRHSDSGSYALVASDGELDKYMTWNYDGTDFWNTSIYESTTTNFYAYFNNGWRIASDMYSATALYTDRQPQEIAFEQETVNFEIYNNEQTKVNNPLSGANTDVTYSIDKPAVATIDASSGEVTIVGIGTAVITAKAAASSEWQSAQASYTLKVTYNPPVTDQTKYVKVTSEANLFAGAKYLVVFEGLEGDTDGDGDPKVFYPVLNTDGNTFVKNASSALDVAISEDTIYSNEFASCEFTLEEGFFLMADEAGKFIYPSGTSGGSGTLSAEITASTNLDITFADGIAQIKAASGSNYLVWSVSSHYFSSNAAISGQYSTGICLYMKDDGRQSQSIAFSADEAEFDVYAGDWTVAVPTLSGAQTTVTYESSNKNVATVNPETGEVSIVSGVKKGDKAVITATAEQDESYRAAKASYTIKVVDSTPTVMTKYYKVDELEAGQSYIIVSDGQAMTFDGAELGVAEVTDVDGVIESDEDLALWAAAEHVEYYTGTSAAGHFTLKSGDSYLQRFSNNSTQTVITGDVPSNGKYYVWEYDGEHLYHLSSATTTFYMGYSSGWIFNNQSPYYTATLYSTTKPLAKQTISFSGKTAVYDVATSDWTTEVPTLTGAQTAVAYTSSNEEVATVDPSTGAVTIASGVKKGDQAVITATAEQDETYKSATDSYTITVDDSSVAVTAYYQKVTAQSEVAQDGTYIIVNEANGKLFKPVLVSGNANFSTSSDNAIDVTISGNTIASTPEVDACQIVLKNADGNGKFALWIPSLSYYLMVYKDNVGAFTADASDNGYRSTFTVTSTGIDIYRDSSHYFRYSGSNEAFQAGSDSDNIALYKLMDGTAPEPPAPVTYTLIEGDANLVSGTYLIVEKTNTYLFGASGSNNGGYATIGTTTGVSISGDTITLDGDIAANYEFEFTRTGDNLTIKQVGGTHAGQYMYATTGTADTYIGFQSSAANFVINPQTGTNLVYFSTTKSTSDPTEYLYKKAADSFFKLGGSGKPGGSDAGIYLYKKN